MKKIKSVGFILAFGFMGFVSPASALDRCDGLVSNALIQSEGISDLYFDMRLAEMQCHYIQKDQNVLNKIAATIGDFETKNASCIKAAQDAMVADLGSENTFDDFYATIGNQIVLLNVADPCGRALKLAQAMSKKSAVCGAPMAAAYVPWFEQLDKAYIAMQKEPLHRICDKTDQ